MTTRILDSTISTHVKIMSIGQTIKHIGTILLITLTVAAQAQTYEVAGCEFLNMREGPASTYPINQRLQSGVNGIVLIGKPVFNGAIKWQQVNSRGVIGWVNAYYLKRLAPPKTTAGSQLSASEVAAYNARMSTRQVLFRYAPRSRESRYQRERSIELMPLPG